MHEKFKKAYLKLKNKNDAQRHSESYRMEPICLQSRANSPPRQQTSGGSNVQLISQQQQQQQ